MSIWTSITGAVKKLAAPLLSSPVLKAVPGIGTVATAASIASAVRGVARGTTKAIRAIPGKGVIAGAATGYALAPSGRPVMDAQGNIIGYRKHRRMNYANAKAARRAARRIRGTLKLLHRIEKSLPHKVVHRRS